MDILQNKFDENTWNAYYEGKIEPFAIQLGVTFNNEDGENRQDILSKMSGSEDITVEKYTYNGEPAAYVKWGDKVIGNLSAELAGDLARKYPKARYTAEILEISGGGYRRSGAI